MLLDALTLRKFPTYYVILLHSAYRSSNQRPMFIAKNNPPTTAIFTTLLWLLRGPISLIVKLQITTQPGHVILLFQYLMCVPTLRGIGGLQGVCIILKINVQPSPYQYLAFYPATRMDLHTELKKKDCCLCLCIFCIKINGPINS